MGFKKGDRVVTNETVFNGREEFAGKEGTVLGSGGVFDNAVIMDDKTHAEGEWLLNDSEIDPA